MPKKYHERYHTNNTMSIEDFVEIGKTYTHDIPPTISKPSRAMIIDLVNEAFRRTDLYLHGPGYAIYSDELEDSEFGWMGMATKKDNLPYQGSFIKRLMSHLWKTLNFKLPQDVVGKIGNVVGKETTGDSSVYLKFDPIANYKDGQFGDGGSCFWTCRQGARMLIRNNGGCFVEFFDSAEAYLDSSCGRVRNGNGIARCWMIPVDQFLGTKSPVFYMGNIYSDDESKVNRYTAVRAIAGTLGMSYKSVRVSSNLDTLYINSGYGFIISSDPEVLENTESVSLRYSDDYDNQNDPLLDYGEDEHSDQTYCHRCDQWIDDDYYNFNHDMCNDCFTDCYFICYACDSAINRDDDSGTELYTGSRRIGMLCEDCVNDDMFAICDGCGNLCEISATLTVDGEDDEKYCEICAGEHLFQCEVCSGYDHREMQIVLITSEVVCPDCVPSPDIHLFECALCGKMCEGHVGAVLCIHCENAYAKCMVCGGYHPIWKDSNTSNMFCTCPNVPTMATLYTLDAEGNPVARGTSCGNLLVKDGKALPMSVEGELMLILDWRKCIDNAKNKS